MGDSYTIQISTKLISQLAREEEKSTRKIKKPKPKTPKAPKDQNTPKPEPPQIPSANPQPTWPPLFLPVPPVPSPEVEIPEVESIRAVLKESEKVLEKLEMEESVMLAELNKRSKELREKEFKLPYQKQVPCVEERSNCLDCYKNYHAKDPLKCAEFVKRFADCARKSRQNAETRVSE